MKALKKALLLSPFLLVLFFSCKDNSPSVDLLAQAQNIMEREPQKALLLLDSIKEPEEMDQESYMDYIVACVQAKYKLYKDITNDTLILETQRYFNKKNNPNKAALANFYTGGMYQEKKIHDKALLCFLEANKNAKSANNNLFIARSHQNIANIYFERDVIDSAIVHYEDALKYYSKEKNTDINRLQVIDLTGRAFEINGGLDSAYFYFKQGLNLAKDMKNQEHEATFNHQLGVVSREKKEYDRAKDYLHTALTQTVETKDSLSVYLNLSKLYNATNRLDSAKHYITLIQKRMTEIKDNYVLSSVCGSFCDYHKQRKDYKEALYWEEQRDSIDQVIAKINSAYKLSDAEKRYALSLQKQQFEASRMRSYLYMWGAVSGIALIVLIICFIHFRLRYKHHKQKDLNKLLESENKLLETKNEFMGYKLQNLTFLQSICHNIINEWAAIEKEVKALAFEYGAKEEPPLYVKIRQLVEGIKQNTNQSLIDWAKDYLHKQPGGQKAMEILSDKDLLIIMLCYCGYSTRDTAAILGVVPSKKNLDMRKLSVRNKLIRAGMSREDVYKLIFPDGEEDY